MQYIIQDPDQLCSALRRGISQIYAKNSSELSFEELYRTSYNLVLVGAGSNAYNGAKDAMLSFLSASLAHLQQGVDRNTFLSSLSSLWLDYCLCIKSTSEVLMYLDRTWVKTQSLPTVHQMGLDTFCSSFMRISSTVFDYMLDAIKSDRDGHQFDHSTLKMLVEMQSLLPVKNPKRNAASLSVYSVHFEPLLIASAMEYYRQAADKINTISPSDYLQYVHTRLIAERSRVGLYLLPESLTKLESALLSEMIVKVHKKILEPSNGLHDMVRLHDLPTLHTLYYLFKSSNLPNNIVDLLPDIIQSMSKPITLQFSESVKSSHWKSQASIWIDSLYEMKVKLDQIIEIGFSRNISFESVILRSFVEAVNSIDRAPELISWYIHDSINKSLKLCDSEIEILLEKGFTLFKCLHDKDMFEVYYKKNLVSRLLNYKVDYDLESSMIAKLKTESGSEFTYKMEGLLREYNLSIEMTKEFREMHKDSIPELNASVFTFTFWPLKVNHYGLRNEALTRVVNRFAGYYSTKHSGRKLTWIFQSGSADIQCKYPSGNYEFNTSTYAMILLTSIFNKLKENERIKLSSIEQETGIEKRELIRTMQSISLGKYRIINKLSKGKEITDDDEFCINQKFTSTLAKFKIATIAQSSTEVDPYEQNKKTLESSRKSQTEACIVRIMKSRKVLSHNDLLIQVAVQLGAKFQPEPKDVKSRIEALIEREYIERDQKDRNLYHYLA